MSTADDHERRITNPTKELSQTVVGPNPYVAGGFDVTFGDVKVVTHAVVENDGGYIVEVSAIAGNVVTVFVRYPTGAVTPADHAQADIVASLADHAVHGHPVAADTSGTTENAEILAGAVAMGAGGVIADNAAAQAHADGAAPVAHAATAPAIGPEVGGINLAGVNFTVKARGQT